MENTQARSNETSNTIFRIKNVTNAVWLLAKWKISPSENDRVRRQLKQLHSIQNMTSIKAEFKVHGKILTIKILKTINTFCATKFKYLETYTRPTQDIFNTIESFPRHTITKCFCDVNKTRNYSWWIKRYHPRFYVIKKKIKIAVPHYEASNETIT